MSAVIDPERNAQTLPDEPVPNAPLAPTDAKEQDKRDANAMMVGGVGIGVFGAVAAAIGGAVCPACVVAAPALLGIGAFRRWRATRTPSR